MIKYILSPESSFTHKLLITIDANSGVDQQITQNKPLMKCIHNHVFGRDNNSGKPLSSKRLTKYNFHYFSVVLTHIDELVNFKKDFEDLKDAIEKLLTGGLDYIKTGGQENIIMAFSNQTDYQEKSF